MKRTVILIACLILFCAAVSHAYNTVHVYINGKVDSVHNEIITIDGNQYKIDPQCRVVIVYNENGSFYERPARVFDISSGDTVTAKKIANTLYEVMIERWRR